MIALSIQQTSDPAVGTESVPTVTPKPLLPKAPRLPSVDQYHGALPAKLSSSDGSSVEGTKTHLSLVKGPHESKVKIPEVPPAVRKSGSLSTSSSLSSMPLPPLGNTVDDEDEELEAPDGDEDDPKTEVSSTGSLDLVLMPQDHTPMYNHPSLHIVVMANFNDGYTLRQQFEFYKCALTCTPMFFTEEGINITRGNGGGNGPTLIVSTKMRAKHLFDYSVDTTRWNWPENKCHVVNVNLADFHQNIKSVAMKEGVRMFQYAEYPQILIIQPYGGNKNSAGHITVRTEKFENLTYDIDDGSTSSDKPNVKVPLPLFCTACANVARVKYPFALLKVYPRGAHLLGGTETGSSSRNSHWGDCTGIVESKSRLAVRGKAQTPIVYTTKIPPAVVKALVKIANFNKGGLVEIYGNGDCVVRIETPIGHYGLATIHLIEPAAKE